MEDPRAQRPARDSADYKGSRSDHSQATGPPQAVWTSTRGDGGAWVTGLPVATGSSGCWGWQPGWSQAAVLEEVGGDARTSGLQVPTGSLHRVRGWGAAPPGGADSAKWAELRGLQSWGAPGWGGHGRGEDAQVWVSLGVRGLPCLAQKATVRPKSCAMGPSALMLVRGPLYSSLAWARLLEGLSEFISPLPLSCIPHPSVQTKWPRMTPCRSPWQLEESPGRRTEPSQGSGPEAWDSVAGGQ